MLLDRLVLLPYTSKAAACVAEHCACIPYEPVMLLQCGCELTHPQGKGLICSDAWLPLTISTAQKRAHGLLHRLDKPKRYNFFNINVPEAAPL
jgi:hypothetical protein